MVLVVVVFVIVSFTFLSVGDGDKFFVEVYEVAISISIPSFLAAFDF